MLLRIYYTEKGQQCICICLCGSSIQSSRIYRSRLASNGRNQPEELPKILPILDIRLNKKIYSFFLSLSLSLSYVFKHERGIMNQCY